MTASLLSWEDQASHTVSPACTLFSMPPGCRNRPFASSTLYGCCEAGVRVFDNRCWAKLILLVEHYHWIKEDLEKHLVGAPAYMDIAFNFHITQYSPHEGTLLEKVATLTRIATHTNNGESSSEGYNSSSPAESINEKERDADEKFRLDEGKEGLVHWHQGRANLSQVIDETVGQAQGSVSVNGERL